MSSPLEPHHVLNLIRILRRANAHYRNVATHIRATLRPSQHARRHAQRLGLKVDIRKAVRCDQKQVSVVPLPILDTSDSPVAAAAPVLPQPSLKRRPALKCLIPGVVTRTTPNGTTSAVCSTVSLSSPLISNGVLGSKLFPARLVSMWSADGEDAASLSSDIPTDIPINVPVGPSTQVWQPLDVPIDEEEMDWGLDDISDMEVSSPGSSSSGSDATSSTDFSAGPTTPVDEEPIMIRIKRKSTEISDDVFEKRPRFEGQEWVHSTMQRKNVRIPTRR